MVQSKLWVKQCALYYPQQYTFPYSLTRAYRDAGAKTPELDHAMNKLLLDLLDLQERRGAWYSSKDGSRDYSTAMALVALLNIGEKRALALGVKAKYDRALEKALSYLYWAKVEHDLEDSSFYRVGYKWKPGLFFSAEESKLGVWRSIALTNAIVVEAFSKYLMGYQKSDASLLEWKSRHTLIGTQR